MEHYKKRIKALEAQNAAMQEALQTVYKDCKIRAVDGVVPIGASCWIKVCDTLQGVGE